jgi:hypothetical protein
MTLSRRWLACGALCAITALAYSNSFGAGFVLDNKTLLLDDSRIHAPTAENLGLILTRTYWWPNGESGLYRPLTTLTYLFNYAILGNADHPEGYHWMNLLLHCGNVLLVFALGRRLVTDFWQAFLIAAVWAAHPVLTESVTNIVGRADLLAGMTTLAGMLVYLQSAESSGRARMGWLALLAGITLVGVFCKESAVALPGIMVLYEIVWWNPRRLKGLVAGCLATVPALLVMWIARSRVMAGLGAPLFPFVDNPIIGANFWIGRLTALKVLARYLGLLIWPARLSGDYSYAQIPLADGRPTDFLAWGIVAAATIGTLLLYRRNKAAFFAAGFSFLTLAPASNLVIPIGTIMAERFLYLPAIGFAICLVLALYSIGSAVKVGPVVTLAAGLVITAALGARTWTRNADWKDDVTFWQAGVEASPLSFKTHTGLAQALHAEGRFDEAIAENERSLTLLDGLPDGLNDPVLYLRTGAQYLELGITQQASGGDGAGGFARSRVLLTRALGILAAHHAADRGVRPVRKGQDADAWGMIAELEQHMGRTDAALRAIREAMEAAPDRAANYTLEHKVLVALGKPQEAMAVLMEGMLITGDADLTRQLLAEYADNLEESRCAISYAEAVPRIDTSCAVVRKQACSVAGEVVRRGLEAGGPELAGRLTTELAEKYGCR